jgi:hypothetical protein
LDFRDTDRDIRAHDATEPAVVAIFWPGAVYGIIPDGINRIRKLQDFLGAYGQTKTASFASFRVDGKLIRHAISSLSGLEKPLFIILNPTEIFQGASMAEPVASGSAAQGRKSARDRSRAEGRPAP